MADTPASPCIGICRINLRAGFCEGCYRTAEEIAGAVTGTDALACNGLSACGSRSRNRELDG